MDLGRALPADLSGDLLAEVLSFKTLYEALSNVVQDAVIEIGSDGRIVRWNLAAETLTGHSAQGTIGRPFAGICAEDCTGTLAAIPADGAAHDLRLAFTGTAGERIDARGHVIALRSGAAADGWLLTCEAARGADEIEQLKNEFVATVSHELRTPLAAIKAYASTLSSNPDLGRAERTEYLTVVEQQADRLARIVDDLLLVTRVEAGQMLTRRVRVALDSVLDRALERLTFENDRYTVRRDTQGVRLSGDPDRLIDVFAHLLDNAVKAMPSGGTIDVHARENGGTTVVDVRDRGVGMAEEHVPLIFDRFYKIDRPEGSAGSGLGLFLVDALVRAHGGTVDVRTAPNAGSTFTVMLPVRE